MKEEKDTIWDLVLFRFDDYHFTLNNAVKIAIVILVAWLLIFLLKRVIFKQLQKRGAMDRGRRFALSNLIRYLILVLATIAVLSASGVDITLLIAGSTALFVGIGFGLQSTFNDLVCGIILLFEGSIEVGNIVEVNDWVGRVTHIGLRASKIQTREGIMLIIPNSRFIAENVINWTHSEKQIRFVVTVGVAYGSDTELVKNVLLKAAMEHEKVAQEPAPEVWFKDFGDSALIFELLFYSENIFRIEFTKSDLRYTVDTAFRKNGIQIPFPQRDLHIRSGWGGE